MADKTEIQVTCEWFAADKSANRSNFVYDSRGRNRIGYTEKTNKLSLC
jgi:hypothetical protein